MTNIPTLLTLLRLCIAPIVMPLMLGLLLPSESWCINGGLAALFILFAATDFLDGYLARRWNVVTPLGRVLDPLADKCFLTMTLIALVQAGRLYYVWAMLLIGREFFIMGLRECAIVMGFSVPVCWHGKLKTALQMFVCGLLIAVPPHLFERPFLHSVQTFCIALMLCGTILSAVAYAHDWYVQWRHIDHGDI